jgi:hypothetical protein
MILYRIKINSEPHYYVLYFIIIFRLRLQTIKIHSEPIYLKAFKTTDY